jgi:hypothetical protein
MMPINFGPTNFVRSDATQTSPELRRLEIYNRARREELDAMLYNLSPRQPIAYRSDSSARTQASIINRMVHGLRDGIGSALITAGNRIQSAA